jgi:hypothetical protein
LYLAGNGKCVAHGRGTLSEWSWRLRSRGQSFSNLSFSLVKVDLDGLPICSVSIRHVSDGIPRVSFPTFANGRMLAVVDSGIKNLPWCLDEEAICGKNP